MEPETEVDIPEYDDLDPTIEQEPELEEEPVDPEQEPEPQEPEPEEPELETSLTGRSAPPPYTPGQEEAFLSEYLDPQAMTALQAFISKQIRAGVQAYGFANAQAGAQAREMPDLFRVHGDRIATAISQLPAEVQQRDDAIAVGIASVFLDEVRAGNGNIKQALSRMAKLANGASSKAPAPPKTPIPASQRPPVVRASSPPSAGGRRGNIFQEMVATRYGLRPEHARDFLDNMED